MTINVDLLTRTLAHIEANPQEWVQKTYRCGSGMCFAGWAATLSGGRWLTDDPHGDYAAYLVAEPDDHADRVFTWGDGTRFIGAYARARRVLGLTDEQAYDLFRGSNGIEYLRFRVAELIAGAGS